MSFRGPEGRGIFVLRVGPTEYPAGPAAGTKTPRLHLGVTATISRLLMESVDSADIDRAVSACYVYSIRGRRAVAPASLRQRAGTGEESPGSTGQGAG